MRRLAGTVSIVTVNEGGQQHGTTATAVTSLSMDPPSVLVCFNRDSRLHGFLSRVDMFCVNLLHTENVDISQLFASKVSSEQRFAQGNWLTTENGPPFLADAQSSLICAKDQQFDYGSHTIFIGRVLQVRNRDDVSPLIYCDGCYAESAVLEPPGSD